MYAYLAFAVEIECRNITDGAILILNSAESDAKINERNDGENKQFVSFIGWISHP